MGFFIVYSCYLYIKYFLDVFIIRGEMMVRCKYFCYGYFLYVNIKMFFVINIIFVVIFMFLKEIC